MSAELDDLFHRLPAALYRTSTDGRVLAANAATAELLGYDSPEELIAEEGGAVMAHADPGDRERWRREIEAHGVLHDFQVRLRRKDGSTVWVRDTARAIYDDQKTVRFYEGVLTDITNEIRASLSSSILTGVLETTTDLVVVFDDLRRLRYANGAARDYLGLTEDRVMARPSFEEVIPGVDWDEALPFFDAQGWSGELSIADRTGRRCPLWVVITHHKGPDGQIYVAAVARHLTQLKATQRRLEELVTAKDAFVATVSHELRNPLTGIFGLAEELREGFADFADRERHDLITLIAHQAGEMTSLVEDLLVAVRSDVGDVAVVPEEIDIVAAVRRLESLFSLGVEWNLPDEPIVAWADAGRLRQIVRNLLKNAERHGGDHRRISIARTADTVVIVVADNGPGVLEEDVERIFEPFQRAGGVTPKQGSVGLGLSVSRRLARLMGGDLTYQYRDGWAEFRLTLPATGDSIADLAP